MGKECEISEDRIISFREKEEQLFVVFEDERRCLEWRTGNLYVALEKLMDELTSDSDCKTESFYKNTRNLNYSLISNPGNIYLGTIFDISAVEDTNPCKVYSAISKAIKVTFVNENGVPTELFVYFDRSREDMKESVNMAYEVFGSRISIINGSILMEYLLNCYIEEWVSRFQTIHLLGNFAEDIGKFEKLPMYGENELVFYKNLNVDSLKNGVQNSLNNLSSDEDLVQFTKLIMLQKASTTLSLHSLAIELNDSIFDDYILHIVKQKQRRNTAPRHKRDCCLDDLCTCTLQ